MSCVCVICASGSALRLPTPRRVRPFLLVAVHFLIRLGIHMVLHEREKRAARRSSALAVGRPQAAAALLCTSLLEQLERQPRAEQDDRLLDERAFGRRLFKLGDEQVDDAPQFAGVAGAVVVRLARSRVRVARGGGGVQYLALFFFAVRSMFLLRRRMFHLLRRRRCPRQRSACRGKVAAPPLAGGLPGSVARVRAAGDLCFDPSPFFDFFFGSLVQRLVGGVVVEILAKQVGEL
mmetsp:Transcript_13321/g.46271  ORF Transcript_13321/g.46271 Transcript_13321/m.46271 type:complete len:235 (-) Transcript_13321:32-736(-)